MDHDDILAGGKCGHSDTGEIFEEVIADLTQIMDYADADNLRDLCNP